MADEVISDVHLGDWGLQMGQLINEMEMERPDLPYFDANSQGRIRTKRRSRWTISKRLYPPASAACKADPARLEQARKATAELQAGRPGYRALWRHFCATSRSGAEARSAASASTSTCGRAKRRRSADRADGRGPEGQGPRA